MKGRIISLNIHVRKKNSIRRNQKLISATSDSQNRIKDVETLQVEFIHEGGKTKYAINNYRPFTMSCSYHWNTSLLNIENQYIKPESLKRMNIKGGHFFRKEKHFSIK